MANNDLVRVLIIEDNPKEAELIERAIRFGGINIISKVVETESEFNESLKEFLPDIIIADYYLQEFYVLNALKNTKKAMPEIPFIILTDTINEEIAISCINSGADNFLLKKNKNLLPYSVKTAIKQKHTLVKKKKEVEQLRESERQFRNYLDNAPDGVFLVDNTGKFVDVNKTALEIIGYTKEELLQLFVRDVVAEESIKDGKSHFKTLFETGRASSELLHIRKDGIKRWWSVNAVKYSETRALGFVKDITEHKLADENLILRENELKAVFENAPLLLVLIDNERRIKRTNNYIQRFTSTEKDKIIGVRLGEAMHCLNSLDSPDGCGAGNQCKICKIRQTVLNTINKQKSYYSVESNLPFIIDGNRTEIYFLLSTTFIEINNEQLVLVCITDITDWKIEIYQTPLI